jgi:diguanylate cyclase (GGDEF)-like protein
VRHGRALGEGGKDSEVEKLLMLSAPIPENDDERIASLRGMTLLSTPREADFDRIVRIARKTFNTEIALITLIDKERQWFKSQIGLDLKDVARDISFCSHAIQSNETFIVRDALHDPRFHDNPLVIGGPGIRFYAGEPLRNSAGFLIGTLCIISRQPREFGEADKEILQDLGRTVELVLDNRILRQTQFALLNSLVEADREKRVDPLTGIWNRRGLDELFDRELARVIREDIPLTVGMADIDYFKEVNDKFGHQVGDEAIKVTATLLLNNLRKTDVVGRYGGEEFLQIIPGIPSEILPQFAEKILTKFRNQAELRIPGGESFRFTISIGFAVMIPQKGMAIDRSILVETADKAMYAAKTNGRDRFHILELNDNL